MSATATVNGKPRKQLSEQLDRLDTILDALGEALPEAVTDACRDGARQAVKEAIVEVLTNPEVRGLLAATGEPTAPPARAPAKPGFWARLKNRVVSAVSTVRSAVRTLLLVVPVRTVVVVGTAVSATVALVARLTPSLLSTAVRAGGGAVVAASGWTRRLFQRPVPAFGVCPA